MTLVPRALFDDYAVAVARWEAEGAELARREGFDWTFWSEYCLTGYKGSEDAEPTIHPLDVGEDESVTVRDSDHLHELLTTKHANERPDPDDYMPEFPEGTATGWCMYETTSEGTPISPVLETPEELARWLADSGASSFGRNTATYDQWLWTIQAGWAPRPSSPGTCSSPASSSWPTQRRPDPMSIPAPMSVDVPLFDVAPVASATLEPAPAEPCKLTEADVLAALAVTYAKRSQGTGDRFAFATHVRSGAGFGDNYSVRTADAVAMDLWPSKGLQLHGHEVKCSRSDWLTELKDPTKCEGVKRYMDRWWLVVADRAIVKPGELPAGWGLMAVRSRRTSRWNAGRRGYDVGQERYCHVIVQAPKLTPEPVSRSFMAALLRATAKTAARRTAS